MTSTDKLLDERAMTHGDWEIQSSMASSIKGAMQQDRVKWDSLSASQREALDMIAVKISRIISGNPEVADHWIDISGYAILVYSRLIKER